MTKHELVESANPTIRVVLSSGEVNSGSERQSPTRKRSWAVASLAALMVLIIAAGLVYWKVVRIQAVIAAYSVEPPPIAVKAETALSVSAPQSIRTIGTLVAVNSIQIAAEASGRVTQAGFVGGQSVQAGDVLIQLDDSVEQAQLRSASARVTFARQQVARVEALLETRTEAVQTLEARRLELEQAQAAVQELQARITQKKVVAPFSGRLGITDVVVGQYIQAGTSIVSLTAEDRLHVDFAVPQEHLTELKTGMNVVVQSDAIPGKTFAAVITAIDPAVDPATRNIKLQGTIENSTGDLSPGLFVTLDVELPPLENVILVPQTAIQASASGDTMYVIKDGIAEAVMVTTGEQVGNDVIVSTGLSVNDEYVVSGQVRIYPGARVVDADTVASN